MTYHVCTIADGGRDYIPKTIDSYLKSYSIDVFVHEDETGGGEPTALLCGETSGTLYHVWGARTHPDHRGRGIMTRMMRYMEDRAHSIDTPVTHMVSTTIQENRSMLNIFETRGYEHHATVFGWPYTGTPQSLKETLLRHGGDEYTSNMIEWVPCRSIEELAETLTMLRAGSQEAPFASGEGIHSLWIPASYEVISSNGPRIIKALNHASSTGNPQIFIGRQSGMPIAVIARIHSQLGSPIASIVYNQPHLATPVISSAFDLVPDLTRLYIDSCHAGHPRVNDTNWHCNALEEEECHEGWYEYMVLIKPMPLCI